MGIFWEMRIVLRFVNSGSMWCIMINCECRAVGVKDFREARVQKPFHRRPGPVANSSLIGWRLNKWRLRYYVSTALIKIGLFFETNFFSPQQTSNDK